MLQLVTGHYRCNVAQVSLLTVFRERENGAPLTGSPLSPENGSSPTAIHSHDQCKIRRMTRRTNPTTRKAFRSFGVRTQVDVGVETKPKS
jgi:hypothetical protein